MSIATFSNALLSGITEQMSCPTSVRGGNQLRAKIPTDTLREISVARLTEKLNIIGPPRNILLLEGRDARTSYCGPTPEQKPRAPARSLTLFTTDMLIDCPAVKSIVESE